MDPNFEKFVFTTFAMQLCISSHVNFQTQIIFVVQ